MQTNVRGSRSRKYCAKCRKYGNHTELLCNEKIESICPFCASTEHSSTVACPQRICTNCRESHLDKRCKLIPSRLTCSLCNMCGHSEKACTNNWRLFSKVTKVEDLDKIGVPEFRKTGIVCTMCGSRHHLSFTCSTLKNTPFYFNPAPKQKELDQFREKSVRFVESFKAKVTNAIGREPTEEAPRFVIDKAPSFEVEKTPKEEPAEPNGYAVEKDLTDQTAQPSAGEMSYSERQTKIANAMALVRKKNEAQNAAREARNRFLRGKLIDEKVRSVATEFNQINSQNLNDFKPTSSTGSAGRKGYSHRKKKKHRIEETIKQSKSKVKAKVHRQASYSNKIMSKYF